MDGLINNYFILENYKYIVDTQDALLNKTLVQQTNIRSPEELNFAGSRFKIIDDKEYVFSSILFV